MVFELWATFLHCYSAKSGRCVLSLTTPAVAWSGRRQCVGNLTNSSLHCFLHLRYSLVCANSCVMHEAHRFWDNTLRAKVLFCPNQTSSNPLKYRLSLL